ncbi:uncharacterized protein LOC132754965 [Ruditapes philippinarum]|uniref:uncharacterized protein LOC132754965 n=1 Tax=Ruditapes philippinarum TaxID=129788 RepID=UPI00295ABB9A|nr:uncharacterized protein LOC132754965 [Ruditapes philippinarum]
MAYKYNPARGHRYTEDQPVYDDGEQADYTEQQHAYNAERQLYNDDVYEDTYQEESTDYSFQECRVRERHDPYSMRNSYETGSRKSETDYTKNVQGHRSDIDVSGKFGSHTKYNRDRTTSVDDDYIHHDVYRRVPGEKNADGGRRYYMDTGETYARRRGIRGVHRKNEYAQDNNVTEHGHNHSDPSSIQFPKSFKSHSVKYEHGKGRDVLMDKSAHMFDQEQGTETHAREYKYGHEHNLTEQGRGFKLGQKHDVMTHDRGYKHGHWRKTSHVDHVKGRGTKTRPSATSQHLTENDSFCDYKNYEKKRQHKTLLPYKKIETSKDTIVQGHSHKLMSSFKQRKSLLSTPDIEPNITEGLLPVPVDSDISDDVQPLADTVHVYSIRDTLRYSTGLLPTPPDIHSTHVSTGLLPTPTASPEEVENIPSHGLLPTPTSKLLLHSNPSATVDKDVIRKVYPSQGLLPTPTASIPTHPLMERDTFVSVYDDNETDFSTDHDVDSSLNSIQMPVKQPESGSNETESVTDTQSVSDAEIQQLQNIIIQTQLTKTLEGMQKTMEILQQKIQPKKHVQGDLNEKHLGNVVLDKELELQNSKVVQDSDVIVERLSDNPSNVLNETDHECVEKIEEIPDNSESEMKRTETESEIDENFKSPVNSKVVCEGKIERSKNVTKESKEEISHKRKQKASQQTGEYRTYREWRLAKERMNRYFYNQSLENEANNQRKLESGESHSKSNNMSNTLNKVSESENVNKCDENSGTGDNKLYHDTDDSNKIGKVNSREISEKLSPDACTELSHHESTHLDKSDTQIVHEQLKVRKPDENVLGKLINKKLDIKSRSKTMIDSEKVKQKNANGDKDKQMNENDKFRYKANDLSRRRNSSDSLSSHHSKDRSTHRHDRSKSRDQDSDKSDKHKHTKSYHSGHSDKHKKSDNHHKKSQKDNHYDKHSSSSKDNKYSSSSKDNKYSSKDSKYKSNDNKYSSRDRKYSSSSKDSKHSSSSKESKYSSSSKDKHQSSFRSEHRSSHEDSNPGRYHFSPDNDKKDVNENRNLQSQQKLEINEHKHKDKSKEHRFENDSKMNLFEKMALENEKTTENKNDTNVKINLFKKLAMENEKPIENKVNTHSRVNLFEKLEQEDEIIDVVGGISSDEDNKNLKNDNNFEYPVKTKERLNDEKYMKTAYVKLYDIHRSKVKEFKKKKNIPIKSRENIFDQMSDEISSGYNSPISSSLKACKEGAITKSTKNNRIKSTENRETVKRLILISEDSSSDVDPFAKMSMFLNKDKKKTIQTNFVKKSKQLKQFLVTDDNTSDCVETPGYESSSTEQKSTCKHGKQKKEFVKFLKRVNKSLYWKDIKLILPRVALKRLDDKDIKMLKTKLKRKYEPEIMEKENDSNLQDKNDSNLQDKKSTENSKTIAENKNNKAFRRIIPITCSSTEQSESSDLERIISPKERRPIIEESDDDFEGSLGSEDSVCFDISDLSDKEDNSMVQNLHDEASRVDYDLHVDPESTVVKENFSPEHDTKLETPVETEKIQSVDRTDEDDAVKNKPVTETLQENDKSDEKFESETIKQGGYKMTCSESAGKHLRRRNHSDSSSDSSEDENPRENKSAKKYQKMQSLITDEKRSGGKPHSNNDNTFNKNTSPKDSVLSHAKQLFKKSKQIKRSSSIMQLDGNADLIAGPPDESSGEEGDVEDNIINLDSDEECSASQDLFADLPKRLVQMSQNFKQIIRSATTANPVTLTEEDEVTQTDDVSGNQGNNNDSPASSDQTQEPGEENTENVEGKEELVIKDEPDWLKCYTQEPDTIFLSDDDDEMIMSVSQPVILVSDDDTQDPCADDKLDICTDDKLDIRVKQEKQEPGCFGSQETSFEYTFEDYSSAEDWSDNGSDFEPENMFQSLQKQTITNTHMVSPDHSLSDVSLISEQRTPKPRTLQCSKDSANEKDGFESSDGPVLSVKEDELVLDTYVADAHISRDKNKQLFKTETEDNNSENMKSDRNLDEDFGSSDDNLLSESAFHLENQYQKTLASRKEVVSHSEDNETSEDESVNKKRNPYMEETQVDPNITDENTSNSVSIFELHSLKFSDISDSDSKPVSEETNIIKRNESSNERNYDYETLSDDSDFMIIDPPKDAYEVNTQVETFLKQSDGNKYDDKDMEAIFGEQTQVNETDIDTDDTEDKTDKDNVNDLYLVQTQADEPEFSSVSGNVSQKGPGSKKLPLQKPRQSAENELYEIQTQVNDLERSDASNRVQFDEASQEDLSDESFSGEDPQLKSYIPLKQQDNNLRNKRLRQNLGIEYEEFSDDNIAYHANTESISSPDNQDSDDSYILTQVDRAPRKKQIEIAMSDTSITNDAYFKATQVDFEMVKEVEKEKIDDQDVYDMATQVDSADSADCQESCDSSIIIISEIDDENQSSDNDAYLQATQAYMDDKNGEQSNEGNIFNMATQIDDCIKLSSDESSIESVSLLNERKDKNLKKVKKQESSSGDDFYQSINQDSIENKNEQDSNETQEEDDFYNMATQKDASNMKMSIKKRKKGIVTIPESKEKSVCDMKDWNASVDDDVYMAATQAFDKDQSEPTEEEDVFNMATQKDVFKMTGIKKKTSIMKNKDNNSSKDTKKSKELCDIVAQKEVNKLSKSDMNKVFIKDLSTVTTEGDDDAFLQDTQAYVDDVTEHQGLDVDDIYNMETQIDVSDTENNNENIDDICILSKSTEKDSSEVTQKDTDVDYDVYQAATQAYGEDINEDENEQSEEEDVFSIATQKDVFKFSSDESDEHEKYPVNEVKQIDKLLENNKYKQFTIDFDDDNDEAYYMETQCDELPDILQSNDEEDLNLLTESTEDEVNALSDQSKPTSNKVNDIGKKTVLGTKSILKRPYAETTGKNVKFDAQFESSVAKKPRFILPERKTVTIEPQKLKTTAEKRVSGIFSTFKSKHSQNLGSSNAGIEMLDATKSDMWLSKKIPSKHLGKKGAKNETVKKRKRKEDEGFSLQAKMMAARSQLKERAMYNATHPDSIKRVKMGPTATVTSSELEDVTLPTESQIIDQGLPLLNSTGLLLKGKVSTPHSTTDKQMESTNTTTSMLFISTSTVSTSITTAVPTSVQSTSVTSILHASISSAESTSKNLNNSKENDKHLSTTQSESIVQRGRSASGDVRLAEQSSVSKADTYHKAKKTESTTNKSSSHSKSDKHSNRNEDGKSLSSKVDKENVSKSKTDNRVSKDREKRSTRERSKSGDSRKERENKDKHRRAERDNDKYKQKSGESKKEKNRSADIKKHDNKKETMKERHSSGNKHEKQKYSNSKHSADQNDPKYKGKENDSKSESDVNRDIPNRNIAPVLSGLSEIGEKTTVVCSSIVSTGLSSIVSTSLSTVISSSLVTSLTSTSYKGAIPVISGNTTQNAINVSTSCTGTIPVISGTTTQNVVNLPTSVTSGTSVCRSTSRPVPTVRTHIESSVLLQKQSSHPPVTCSSINEPPTIVAPSRQPLQPLLNDNIYNTFNNVSTLKWDNFLRVILKWSPNWFEEREKMEQLDRRVPPPDVTNDLCGHGNHMLFPLIGKYVSFKEYSEKFMLPLLLHETWESCYSTWRERKNRRKLVEHKMMFSHQAPGGDKLIVYTLLGLISERDIGNNVTEGDLVKLTINGDMKMDNQNKRNLDYTMSGYVDNVKYRDFSVDRICAHYKEMGEIRKGLRNCISVKVNVRVRSRSFIPSDKVIVHLQSISTIMNTWRQFTGLSCIPRSPLCRDLLYPTANMTYCDKAPASVQGAQDKYNESQSKAINTAGRIVMLPKELPRICLLQGPPGTGKSHTIVGIIKHIVKVMRGKCRICLTAPSNAAVDELLRRLIKYNRNIDKNDQIKLVRLGKKSSVHEDIHSLCLDNLVEKNLRQAQKEELLKQLPMSLQEERKTLQNKIIAVTRTIETAKDQYQRQKHRSDLKKLEKQKEVLESKYVLPKAYIDKQQERQAQCNLLLKAHVIAGTLSKIGGGELRSAFQNMTGPGFDVVIVDEATQAIELETLIPLQYGVTKLILVGDPEQLPPTVLSQKATENQFNMSLFERLDGHFKGQSINPVILLNRQYRMDPEIAAFPNNYIYEGKITNDKCVENRSQLPLVPYLLFNVSEGRELFSQGTRSMSNPLEAIFTAELCKFIITNSSVIEKVIGIIAPYAKQKSEIVKELEKRHLNNIEVSTVDGFQGREKHVIIMSCVRANQSGTIGFVGDRKRMNVSLTRAKYAMYLVGRFESLEVSDEWKALLADARHRRKIINVDQFSMQDAIKQIFRNL